MSAANGGVIMLNLTPEEFYVDGGSVLSGSSVEPDNTNGSKSNHQHKEAFWRQVEMRNLTYD